MDLETYTKTHFGMFEGEGENVTIRFTNNLLDAVVDRFGTKGVIYQAHDTKHFTVTTKDNVLRLCIGLELNLEQAEELLNSAGYMLSNAVMTDVVIKAFLHDRIYSVVAINTELYENNAPMLFEDYIIRY